MAQSAAAPATSAPGATAPGANAPAAGVSSGLPAAPVPGQPLTLSQVVLRALSGNSGLVDAQQRLEKAQELINQVNAQEKPQIRADAIDTYSSFPAFAPAIPTPAITNPVLPGGSTIPTVVDQASGFSSGYVGGGGTISSFTSTPGIAAGGTSAGPSGPVTGVTGAAGPLGPAAPSSGTPSGTSPSGASASGASATGASGAAFLFVPSLIQNYVTDTQTITQPPASRQAAAEDEKPADTVLPEADQSPETSDAQPRAGGTTTSGGTGSGGTAADIPSGSSPVVGQRNALATRVSVSQYIDLFGLVPAARDAQTDVRNFYRLDITRLQNETALAAKNLFFDVLLAQAQVATEQEQVTYAQQNVTITQDRLQQGIVSRFDVLTAQTALATAQQQLIAAQDQQDLAQSNLSYLLGTNPDQPLPLQAPPLPPLSAQVDLMQSTQIALRQRPELGQAVTDIGEAQRLVKLAGETLLPTLGIVGSGYYDTVASTTAPHNYAQISAVLGIPLDDGGATRSRVRSAKIDLQTQDLTLEQLKLSVALEVRQAAINVRNAQAQVGAAQAATSLALQAVQLAYDRYQAGLGTFLDVLNSLAQLATARTNLAEASFFYQTSLAQLVRAMGGR